MTINESIILFNNYYDIVLNILHHQRVELVDGTYERSPVEADVWRESLYGWILPVCSNGTVVPKNS